MLRRILSVLAIAAGVALSPGVGQATVISTNFSDVAGAGADPNAFAIGPASFTGGEVFFAGVMPLYRSNPNAWVVGTRADDGSGGILEVTFNAMVTNLTLSAIGLSGAILDILGDVNETSSVDVTGTDIKDDTKHRFSFSGLITGFRLQNTSMLPNVGNFAVYGASIDDLEFTVVPEPASLSIFLAGLAGMAAVGFRRRRSAGTKAA